MNFKKLLPHIVAVILFFVLNAMYFSPQLSNQRIQMGDIVQYQSMIGEKKEFEEKLDRKVYWNNGMFVGLPTGTLVLGRDKNLIGSASRFLHQMLGHPIGAFFRIMLICYICLILLKVNPYLSMVGAVAYAFNTNFLVLLEAGHNTKISVITYFPMILAGILIAFQKRYLLGGVLMAIGSSVAIYHNHPQMAYYFVLCVTFLGIALTVDQIIKKQYQVALKAVGVLILGGLLGLMSNTTSILSSMETAEGTMRGEPILTASTTSDTETKASKGGLDWDYAMAWSNSALDVFALAIPGVVGGSSAEEVASTSASGKLLRQNNSPRGKDGNYKAPLYWGNLNFTSGPYYIGGLILFLFVLSLFFHSNALRIGLGLSILFGLLMSMGKEAEWLNRFLFENMPLFNKFRTPNSVMPTLPILFIIPAMLGIDKYLNCKNQEYARKSLFIAFGILAAISLFFAVLGPGMFDFTGPGDGRYNAQVLDIFKEDRMDLMRSDAFRVFFVVALTAAILFFFKKQKKVNYILLAGALLLLNTTDLYSVGKRYVDADNFVAKNAYKRNFAPRPIDEQIKKMEPKGRGYYRVFDLSINTFNSASTSYHHNTVGGYSPKKLRRIQDIIDRHISKNNMQVLNMLNTKYIINRNGQVQTNPAALGNAWFVNDIQKVNSPEEEINALSSLNTKEKAVVLFDEFKDAIGELQAGDGQGQISLTDYAPDHLVYTSNTSSDQIAVFSEAWYGPDKGWTATIDGKEVPIFRANYMLRALKVPAGEHQIVFTFEPEAKYGWVSLLASVLILGLLGWLIYSSLRTDRD